MDWLPLVGGLVAVIVAAVLLIVGTLVAVRQFYVVPKADEALVKTGGGKTKVSIGAGMWVIPMFHEVARVSLQTFQIPIDRTGADSVPSGDMIPAEIKGEMFVQIDPKDESIQEAVRSLGVANPRDMAAIVRQKIDGQITGALRTAAFQRTFIELNSKKKEFADQVMAILGEDLNKLGLTLRSVAVTHVTQGPFNKGAGDVIAAQGQRNVAETVELNRQETNKITREAEVKVLEQNVSARERALALQLTQTKLEANQAREAVEYEQSQETLKAKAVFTEERARAEAGVTKDRAVQEAKIKAEQDIAAATIESEKEVALRDALAQAERAKALAEQRVAQAQAAQREAEADIQKERALDAARIEKERTIQQAEIEKARTIEQAEIDKVRALKVADEQRQQAVEEAAVARLVSIAEKKAEEAAARTAQATAEADQKAAEEKVVTIKATADAERAKAIGVIQSQEQSEKEKIAADKQAYTTVKRAEAERDAIRMQAQANLENTESAARAKVAAAKGEADAMKANAQGYADNVLVRAEADAKAADQQASAKIKMAQALLEEGKAVAESKRLEIEAGNAIGRELLLRDVTLKALDVLPAVAREIMTPVGKVAEGTKILQIQGMDSAAGGPDNLPMTVLKTGVMATGILPLVQGLWAASKDQPEVKEAVELFKNAVVTQAKSAAKGALEGVNGASA